MDAIKETVGNIVKKILISKLKLFIIYRQLYIWIAYLE